MDAYLAFTLGAFIGLIVGFGLACIRPTASETEVAQAYEAGALHGELQAKQSTVRDLASVINAARRVA